MIILPAAIRPEPSYFTITEICSCELKCHKFQVQINEITNTEHEKVLAISKPLNINNSGSPNQH